MYYLLLPKKKTPLPDNPLWKVFNHKVSGWQLLPQPNGVGYTLQFWFAEGKEWLTVSFVEFFFQTNGGDLYLQGVDVTVQTLPAYLDRSLLIKKMLESWHQLLDDFVVRDMYSGEKLPYTTAHRDRARTEALMSEMLPEIWELQRETVTAIDGNTNAKAVLKRIKALPPLFRSYLYSLYLRLAGHKQQLNNEITQIIVEEALRTAARLDSPQMQAYALYNVILYYKHLKASVLLHLGADFVVRTYTPFVLKLPSSLEIVQILQLDLFLYFLDTRLLAKYKDHLTALIQAGQSQQSLFVPELKTLTHYYQNGNATKAVRVYLKWAKRQPWLHLRRQYHLNAPEHCLVVDFERNVVVKNYLPKMSWWDRYWVHRQLEFVARPKSDPMLWLALTAYLTASLPLFWFAMQHYQLQRLPEVLFRQDQFLSADTLGGLVVINTLVMGSFWSLILRFIVLQYKKWKAGAMGIWARALLQAVLITVIGLATILFFAIGLAVNLFLAEDGIFLALTKTKVISGFTSVPIAHLNEVDFDAVNCASTVACQSISLNLTYDHSFHQSVTLRHNPCAFLKEFEPLVFGQKIPTQLSITYRYYRSLECKLPAVN